VNASSPHEEGSAQTAGSGHVEPSNQHGLQDPDERDLRWEIRGRLHACLAELGVMTGVDWDVVETLLAGALEEIRAATT
jgi:hypothetical protein